MKKSNLTDIICIGAQKCGTSWLHHVLCAHPKIQPFLANKYTSTNKEAHFWDWNYKLGLEWYKDLMTVPENKLSLDFTPEYSFVSEERIAQCKKYSPNAKIIYILRDPVERALSSLRMFILRDKSKNSNFKLEYNNYFLNAVKKSRIKAHSNYGRNFNNWSKYFNIKIIDYEDIKSNKWTVLNNVYEFLSLSLLEMNHAEKSLLKERMNKIVWKSKDYEIDRECKIYLEGLLCNNYHAYNKILQENL